MNEGFIAVIDSGIGGLSLLTDLIKNFPSERFLYFGDNKNAPYGNKSKRELESLTLKNIEYVSSFGVKAIVFACNTISVNILGNLADRIDIPIFGIFPPVESRVMAKEKTLLLCTERTAEHYREVKGVDVVGLPTLVKEIEKNALCLSRFNAIDVILRNHNGLFIDKKGYYDTVILGCTHFVFIKKQILDHFCPKNIVTGNDFTVKKLSNYLINKKSLVKYKRFSLLFVGECAKYNQLIFEKSG